MSIASIIRGNEFDELKDYIKTYAPKKKHFKSSTEHPAFSKEIPIKVPAENLTSHESGHVGELTDFLFCLEIARYVDVNKNFIFGSLIWRPRQLFDGCIRRDEMGENNQKHREMFDSALSNCSKYVMGEDVELRELVYFSNIINKAEHYLHYTKFKSREEFLEDFLVPCPDKIVDDVVKLVAIFREKFIFSGIVNKDSVVVCHPWFEPWSSEVSGGVADLYLDGVLYDFKSTKKTGYSWEDVGQLYGYYLLHRLCLKYSKDVVLASPIPITNIDAIALYYSRLGDIEICNLLESNRILPDSEVEYIADIIHEHNEDRYQDIIEHRLEDIAKDLILREMRTSKMKKENILHTPETIGYGVGDTIYSYSHGKGIILSFKKDNDTWKTVIGFESGQILEGDINSMYLLNWNSGELLEWRKSFDCLHQINRRNGAAVAELIKKNREL